MTIRSSTVAVKFSDYTRRGEGYPPGNRKSSVAVRPHPVGCGVTRAIIGGNRHPTRTACTPHRRDLQRPGTNPATRLARRWATPHGAGLPRTPRWAATGWSWAAQDVVEGESAGSRTARSRFFSPAASGEAVSSLWGTPRRSGSTLMDQVVDRELIPGRAAAIGQPFGDEPFILAPGGGCRTRRGRNPGR